MKKLLIASLALAGTFAANAAVGGVAVQKGFALTNEYEVAVSTNQDAFRSGVGVGDKFYAPNIRENKVYVYDKEGNVSTITPPAGKYVWTSCQADASGHVLVRVDGHAFNGSVNGATNGFMVIDPATDQIVVDFLPMTFSGTYRFDAMGSLSQSLYDSDKFAIYCPLQNQSAYRFLYNQVGAEKPTYWTTKPMPRSSEGIVATTEIPSLFPAPANTQTTTGVAMQFKHADDEGDAFTIAIYANPEYTVTYSAEGKYGNGIRRFTGGYVPTEQWYYTPQHGAFTGFNIFSLGGKDYIIYPSGAGSMTADPFAIAEVSYVSSPATDMSMEGETLVDGKPVGVLKARTFAAAGTDGNPLYKAQAWCPPTYNVVPVEGDENSVYIYVYNSGAPAAKWKFSVNVPEEQPSTATGEGTLESPYNVAKALEIIAAGTMTADDVYVQGKIKSITELSTQFGNATYYITDEGSDNEFMIFRGKALGNQKFTADDEIVVGDDVVVLGKLIDYVDKNDVHTPEMASGNYIVKLNGKEYEEPAGPDFSDCTGTEEATIAASDITLPVYKDAANGYGFNTVIATGATAPTYNGSLRLYADNTMTIYGGKLTRIEFVIASTNSNRYTTLTASTGTVAEQSAYVDGTVVTWTGDANEVTFTVGHDATLGSDGSTSRGQIHVSEIIINKPEEVAPVEPTLGKVGEVLTQPGYTLTPIYTVEGLDQSNSRSGILYNDKVYVPNLFGNLVIYNVAGEVIKTIPPTEGYKMWTSCNLDAAGHLLVQIDNTTAATFGDTFGNISANGGHGFMVIDTETDEVILPFMQMKSSAQRYDCMAPVAKDLFTDEVVGVYETLANGTSSFRYLYNQRGVAEKPNWWDCKPMARTGEGIVATDAIPSLFPSPANKQTTTGYAIEYVHNGDANFSLLIYANPEYHVTYSAEGMFGNGIRKFTAAYAPTEQWYYTPQHSGLTGFNIFKLDGKEYMIYPAIDGNSAYNDPFARPADAFAIAEVSYVDGPATDMTMAGETLVDGKLAGTLKARAYGLVNEAGTAPVYQSVTATAPAYTVVPVEGDSKSVYILMYNNGAPAAKWQFSVSETTGVEGVETVDADAPAVYYNMQGVRVANPAKGLYIRVQGNKATKVVL